MKPETRKGFLLIRFHLPFIYQLSLTHFMKMQSPRTLHERLAVRGDATVCSKCTEYHDGDRASYTAVLSDGHLE